MESKGSRKGLMDRFIDRIEGDKVVLFIVSALTLISALAIFSSTSQLAGGSLDRMDLIKDHLKWVICGYALIFIIYKIKSIRTIRIASQLGFLVSFTLLLLLDCRIKSGFISAINLNDAYRILRIGGFQLHVFEATKVCMVMYVAWALHSYRQDCEAMEKNKKSPTFTIANRLSRISWLSFLKTPRSKRIIYLYAPVLIVAGMVLPGSNSSMMLIGGICFLMLMIGKMPMKEIGIILGTGVAVIGICAGIFLISDGKIFENTRLKQLFTRIGADYSIERLIDVENDSAYGPKSREWYRVLDKIRQPYGAQIAIHEGGIFGKFSGNSTQKYVVAHIYSDYMFSFIVEEYGLLGGIVILILFISLLARGSYISSMCKNDFAKYAVGGLSLLISGQAFLHILVNVGITPMTGQTLPMISDGSFAFVMFCIAFGIILSISRMAQQQIRQEEEAMRPLYEKQDDLQATMDVLEMIDNYDEKR